MGKARFSLKVLTPPRLLSCPQTPHCCRDDFLPGVFGFRSHGCDSPLTQLKFHRAWGPRQGGVSADRGLMVSRLPLSPQVLYNVFESFVTLGGDKVTGVDCAKGIGG